MAKEINTSEEGFGREQTPQVFWTKAPDNAMFPDVRVGEPIAIDSSIAPQQSDIVLLRDRDGKEWLRLFQSLPGYRFNGYARNKNYHCLLESREHGLIVVGVLVGHFSGRSNQRPMEHE